jgi:ketosteroid isomerase-like protein
MDSNQNKQLIMQGYERFQQGDIKGVLALCSDDVQITSPENEHVPFTGRFDGLYGAAEYFAKLGGSLEPVHFAPKDFVAEGDKVVVTGEARWHVKSTGADFLTPWVHVFTLRDGKICRFEQMSDTAAAVAAFRGPQMGTAESAVLRH